MKISAKEAAVSTRWVGGLNPFAIYDVAIHKFTGSGKIGVMFRDSEAENRISVTLVAEDGAFRTIRSVITSDGKEVDRQEFALPKAMVGKDPIRLRVQMLAVGANYFVERAGKSTLIGHADIRRLSRSLHRIDDGSFEFSGNANAQLDLRRDVSVSRVPQRWRSCQI